MENCNYFEYKDINGNENTIYNGDIYNINDVLYLVAGINENNIKFAQLSTNSIEDYEKGNHDVIKYFNIKKLDFMLSLEETIKLYEV